MERKINNTAQNRNTQQKIIENVKKQKRNTFSVLNIYHLYAFSFKGNESELEQAY